MTTIGAIVQARMSSQRFAAKALHPVGSKPVLQYVLERVERSGGIHAIVVCTSTDESDEPIASFCRDYGVACHRGGLLKVAGRYKEVLERYSFDGFVRINGDSPLIDPHLIDRGVGLFQAGDYDLVTNAVGRTFPPGQGVEVLRSARFLEAYPLFRRPDELEHVTTYFYENPERFRIFTFASNENWRGVRLAVDTPEDMSVFEAIVAKMSRPHWEYHLKEIAQRYREVTSAGGRCAVG